MGSFYQYYSICTPSVPQYNPIPRILPLFGRILDTTQYVPPAFLRNTTQYNEYYHYYKYSCSADFTSAVDSRFIGAFEFALHRQVQSYLKLENGADQLENRPTFFFVKTRPAQLEKPAVSAQGPQADWCGRQFW